MSDVGTYAPLKRIKYIIRLQKLSTIKRQNREILLTINYNIYTLPKISAEKKEKTYIFILIIKLYLVNREMEK